jgi:ABC-2 type transport system ATP-binding protein
VSATDHAVAASDLVKTYPGGVRALQGVSLAVPEGTVFGLLGPNGAGKSTTVKILTTLTRADSGEARVAGHDVAGEPDRVRRAIGCVFQKHAVDLEATGRENLLLQGHLYGLRGGELRTRAAELLDRFGLADAGGRLTRTYSGGMQRKLDVAMGLVHRPRVLFLDEPTTGLDPEARAEMWTEISGLAREEGLTVLLTTHYLEEADRLADRLVIVDSGRVVAEGTAEELKSGLRGDALVVELAGSPPAGAVRAALRPLAALRDLTVDGGTLRARVDDGARAVPAVLAALENAGLAAGSVTVARPSLDDVYLRLTGRTFDSADSAGSAGGHDPGGGGTAAERTEARHTEAVGR